MDKQASVISALAADILGDSSNCEENAAPSHTLVNTRLVAQCTKCKDKVLRDVEFSRVLPLPSVDWEQASEGMEVVGSKRMCKRELEIRLRCVYAVKLLYQVKEGEDEETGGWVDDVNVHIIPCSVSMLEEVRDKLITSTSYLPTNMKVIDDLSVGYIVKNQNNSSKL
ncbi:hypothetical protein Pcinc_014376 [Petrolisthes cinctipes]|uniref:Uncharacterized protein n=1 Tax=Petrolisthes cinctipes TaxID=88211 RepID=A0AAE1FWP3_PETCI|nr:hypothetical protein Pcinc_014376 [Petrolisthes cinctipes]